MTPLLMIRLFLVSLGLGAALNFLLSMLGMAFVFKTNNFLGYALCGTAAFTGLALKLSTHVVYSNRKVTLYKFLYYALWLASLVDLYAVFMAVSFHIVGKQPVFEPPQIEWADAWGPGGLPTKILATLLTLLLVVAPIGFSCLLPQYYKQQDSE